LRRRRRRRRRRLLFNSAPQFDALSVTNFFPAAQKIS